MAKGFFSEFGEDMERRLNITLAYMGRYIPADAMGNFTFGDSKRYLLGLTNPPNIREEEVTGETPPIQFYVTSPIGIEFLFATYDNDRLRNA